MEVDSRVDEVAAQGAQPRERALLVGAGELGKTHHVGRENGRQLALNLARRHPRLPRWSRRNDIRLKPEPTDHVFPERGQGAGGFQDRISEPNVSEEATSASRQRH